jgi:hypothetical protein
MTIYNMINKSKYLTCTLQIKFIIVITLYSTLCLVFTLSNILFENDFSTTKTRNFRTI